MTGPDTKRPSLYNTPDDEHFDEDSRPAPEHEDDHSDPGFDMEAELHRSLGAAEKEPVLSAPPKTDASAYNVCEQPFDDAEDVRPCYEGEDDHSTADFDLHAEIERQRVAQQKTRTNAAPADDAYDELYPEGIRPSYEGEDDHSLPDIDLNAEIDRQLGAEKPEELDAMSGSDVVHPGLVAALSSSFAYATQGVSDAGTGAEPDKAQSDAQDTTAANEAAARNPDGLGVEDDSRTPVEPEDSGEDEGPSFSQDEAFPQKDAPLSAMNPAFADHDHDEKINADRNEDTEDDAEDDEEDDDDDDSGSGGGDGGGDDDDDDEEEKDDQPMTFADHFRELRKRLFRSFLLVLLGFFCCYPFAEELFSWLLAPLMTAMPDTSTLIYTSPPEAFFTYMKVSFVAGMFAASPLIFYQVWAFVAPGLYKEEKLYILPVAIFSAFFFISGGAFCYFIVFPFAFEFFMSYNTGIIQAMPALSETLSFVLKLLLAFGLVFEMPLFAFFLSRMGILTADMMRRFRRYAVLVMFIVAAILTPPDVLSQLLMAGPLLVLYEVSILIAAIFGKKKPQDEDDDEEDGDDEDEKLPTKAGA